MVRVFVERYTRMDDVIMLSVERLQMFCDHRAQLRLDLGMLSFDVDLYDNSFFLLRTGLCAVLHVSDPLCAGIMGAAIYRAVYFDTMAEDAAATVFARRGKRLNGAFKAIERMRGTTLRDLKGFIVLVAAGFTLCHGALLPVIVRTL
jgi:hypothetical protein